MTNAPEQKLTSSIIKSSSWTVGARIFAKIFDLVALIFLARFLSPSDFGLVAMSMTTIFIVEAIFDLPLSSILVREKNITDKMLETAFTIGLIRGLIVTIVVIFLSWPLSLIYNEPRLLYLTPVLALAPFLRGLISPKMATFAKKMDFKREFIAEIVSKLIVIPSAICIAFLTNSFWSIVISVVGTPLIGTFISYALAPMNLNLTLKFWPLFAKVAGWYTLSQILSAVNWQVDRILLPKFTDTKSFGTYTTASDIAAIPFQSISVPIVRPLISAFTIAYGNGNIEILYLRSTYCIFALMAPILAYLGLMSKPLIILILGEKWIDASDILTGISYGSIFAVPAIVMPALALTVGRPQMVAIKNAVELAVRLPMMIVGIALMGIVGALISRALASLVIFITSAFIVNRLIGVSISKQFIYVIRLLLSLSIPCFFIKFCLLENFNNYTFEGIIVFIIFTFFIFIFSYITILITLGFLYKDDLGIEISVIEIVKNFILSKFSSEGRQ